MAKSRKPRPQRSSDAGPYLGMSGAVWVAHCLVWSHDAVPMWERYCVRHLSLIVPGRG
jgi:hypothetical protein